MIAIDGPAASGKTTVAVRLADRLGAVYLDTGLLYRAATVLALRDGLGLDEGDRLAERINAGVITIRPPSVRDGRQSDVLLDGVDITPQLRLPAVDRSVSAWSALSQVRKAMLPLQRGFARNQRVIMAGRDIATVVFPDAAVKIYLDASVEERARRRWRELVAKDPSARLEDVEADLRKRDQIDSSRDIAPLEIAAGATVVDTDGKSIDQVVDEIAAIAERQWQRR